MTPSSQPARVGRQARHRLLATDPRHEPLFPTTLLDLQATTGDMVDVGWLLAAWTARTSIPPALGRAGRTPRLEQVDYPWPLSIDPDGPRPAYVGAATTAGGRGAPPKSPFGRPIPPGSSPASSSRS